MDLLVFRIVQPRASAIVAAVSVASTAEATVVISSVFAGCEL